MISYLLYEINVFPPLLSMRSFMFIVYIYIYIYIYVDMCVIDIYALILLALLDSYQLSYNFLCVYTSIYIYIYTYVA